MIAIDTDISAHQAAAQERDRGQLRMIAAALTAQTPEQFAAGLDAIIERIRS